MTFSNKMKLIDGVYILALVASFAGNCASISGGTSVTNLAGFKYQVAVLCPITMCSGAIVSSKNVLTTGTCINNLSPGDVELYVGSNKYYDGGYTYYVANILIHPSFNPSTYDYNIALLTATTQFDFNVVTSIALATVMPADNQYVSATSYGAINTNMELPDVLQRASFLKYPKATCQLKKNNRLTATMFCVGDLNGIRDTCPGDQGAPAVYNNVLVGIYSWGASCGTASPNPSSPVFTSIPYLYNWITPSIAAS